MLGKGHHVGEIIPDGHIVDMDPCPVGSKPGEETHPARIADGGLAIRSLKKEAFGCQFIDVGGMDVGRTIASQFGPKVIHHDQQDIGRGW
jgi:hypothetical protein